MIFKEEEEANEEQDVKRNVKSKPQVQNEQQGRKDVRLPQGKG